MSVTDPEEVAKLAARIAELDGIFTDISDTPHTNASYPLVTRVEFIVDGTRAQVVYGASEVSTSLQDDDRTLKVFLKTNK